MNATPELLMLIPTLLSEIRLASTPGTKAAQYRPARENVVRLTRKAVRLAIATEWRETMRQSVQASADHRSEWNEKTAWEQISRDSNSHTSGDF